MSKTRMPRAHQKSRFQQGKRKSCDIQHNEDNHVTEEGSESTITKGLKVVCHLKELFEAP